MGGDYGEEDERQISRLENAQFDASMAPPPHMQHIHPHQQQPPLPPHMMAPQQRMPGHMMQPPHPGMAMPPGECN
jgi:hypothetical protein